MQRGSECGIFVGTFDQAQVQDRESSHYGLWQISIGSNDKLLYNSAKQHTRQHKYTLGLTETQRAASPNCTVVPLSVIIIMKCENIIWSVFLSTYLS